MTVRDDGGLCGKTVTRPDSEAHIGSVDAQRKARMRMVVALVRRSGGGTEIRLNEPPRTNEVLA